MIPGNFSLGDIGTIKGFDYDNLIVRGPTSNIFLFANFNKLKKKSVVITTLKIKKKVAGG